MRFWFIDENRQKFAVLLMYKVLAVSPSGYYALRRRPPAQEMADRRLRATIRHVFEGSGETYGSPRIYQAMKKMKLLYSMNRVARLMQAEYLRARQTHRFHSTTKRNGRRPVASNLLQRDSAVERPNQNGSAPTCKGWMPLPLTMAGTSTTMSSGMPAGAPR